MKKLLWFGLFAVLLVSVYFLFLRSSEPNYLKVLVFSKTASYRHESIEAGQEAFQKLADEHGFEVSFSEEAALFHEDHLSAFNVVVFLNTTGDILNPAQQLEFNRWIQAGGGFVGIHAAADTEYDWPYYGELVGAYFHSHPPQPVPASLQVIDPEHISTKGLPEIWSRTDEWYNYQNYQPGINVLVKLDESTYEGGTNGAEHAIAWYREFDGGRMWYTGLGHVPETFAEPEFISHLWGGIQYAAGSRMPVNYEMANVAPEENRFTKTVFLDNLYEPMELEMLPNGNLIFIQRRGEVIIYDPETRMSREVNKFEVFYGLEDGLIGMALDPNVESNNWIYLFYSHPEDTAQYISRFTMVEDYTRILPETEQVLLTVPTQRLECCHSGGSMEFGPGGLLYIALGDNTNPHASDGYAPIDDRPGRSPWDARKSSANTQDLRGKVLRIRPTADGYEIPDGNLFADASEGRPEIFVMGCRNPYRLAVDQRTGYLYWGDVGPDANSDSTGRGPRGHDEINQARSAGNFGWPLMIGNNKPYHAYDFDAQQSGEAFDPAAPVNDSRYNTGARELPPAQSAFIWYPYDGSSEFPLLGDGGRTAMAGPVFYKDDYPESDDRYPDYYDGKLFIYEWMRGWMMAVTLDDQGNYKRMERFLPKYTFSNPVDMLFGPAGDIYMLEYGAGWFQQNPDARLVHLDYTAGNRQPVAEITANARYGKIPMNLELSAENSVDYDGDELTYVWTLNGESVGTDVIFTRQLTSPGEYQVGLRVIDPEGEFHEAMLTVSAGNSLPEVSWEFEGNRSFYWDDKDLVYEVRVKDEEDGSVGDGIDPGSIQVSIDYLKEGADLSNITLGHEAQASIGAGKNLIANSDCRACHDEERTSVGPSYTRVAERYREDPNARAYLIDKVQNGGGGTWGEVAMAAHPALSDDDAGLMVDYILSLGREGGRDGSPYMGTLVFDRHIGQGNEGSYVLTASYTDRGGDQIGPLTSRDIVILRSPMMWAHRYKEATKGMKIDVAAGSAPGVTEDITIVLGDNGSSYRYDDIDFTGISNILLGVAQFPSYFKGGEVELVLDSPDGEVLASTPIVQGLTDMGEKKFTLEVPPTSGRHDLYVNFNSEEGAVCAFVYMIFNGGDSSFQAMGEREQ